MNPFFKDASRLISFTQILVEESKNVLTLKLNRPEKRNAFTPTMIAELAYALQYAQHNSEIWCVVLEAKGPVFCAGMDLNVFQNPDLDVKNDDLPNPTREITIGDAFMMLCKPSIAKVEGNVLAGGFLFVCGCTFVVATKNVEFGLPEVKRGIFPMQVMASLLRIMPQRKVLEMCVLGKNYTAKDAFEMGIVTHLIGSNDNFALKHCSIDEFVDDLINEILQNAPFAITKGMEALNGLDSIEESEKHAFLINQLNQIRKSEDAQEGINAFREKRKPVWKNK
ncbi:MAG: enoyl-CoA hydratase-related protein [Spirosomaceae bacterium]|jgi:enoyl-CoA hydratase/carnithine racemase|nr:enoyl-CoA hydratase-related protein [Spirosomataceae bacterium]